jgi:hypothetical protein
VDGATPSGSIICPMIYPKRIKFPVTVKSLSTCKYEATAYVVSATIVVGADITLLTALVPLAAALVPLAAAVSLPFASTVRLALV